MENALLLAAIIGPFYLIMGLSMLLHVKQWKKLIAEITNNHFMMLANIMIALIVGLIILNMYSTWDWSLYVIITITGWGALLKGVFYFLAPSSWIKSSLKSSLAQSEGWLYFWGAIMTFFGVLLSYNAYFV